MDQVLEEGFQLYLNKYLPLIIGPLRMCIALAKRQGVTHSECDHNITNLSKHRMCNQANVGESQ